MLKRPFWLIAGIVLMITLTAGCSDDGSTVTGSVGGTRVDFADYRGLIERIAPPVYEHPALTPTLIDSVWTFGEYPLLGKVFSENEPMSLYSNLDKFDMAMEILGELLKVDANGDYYADSMVTVTTLAGPTILPATMQPVLGESVTVEHLATVQFPGDEAGRNLQIGFTKNETVQTVLLFFSQPQTETPGNIESSVFYASFNPVDSSIVMKGMVFIDYVTTVASWVYEIGSINESDFAYRMAWYSNDLPDSQTLLGCIVGGGNKDAEFALKYREFVPADSTMYNDFSASEEIFGPYYTEGTGLISAFADYIDDSLLYPLSAQPSALLVSPWAE